MDKILDVNSSYFDRKLTYTEFINKYKDTHTSIKNVKKMTGFTDKKLKRLIKELRIETKILPTLRYNYQMIPNDKIELLKSYKGKKLPTIRIN